MNILADWSQTLICQPTVFLLNSYKTVCLTGHEIRSLPFNYSIQSQYFHYKTDFSQAQVGVGIYLDTPLSYFLTNIRFISTLKRNVWQKCFKYLGTACSFFGLFRIWNEKHSCTFWKNCILSKKKNFFFGWSLLQGLPRRANSCDRIGISWCNLGSDLQLQDTKIAAQTINYRAITVLLLYVSVEKLCGTLQIRF